MESTKVFYLRIVEGGFAAMVTAEEGRTAEILKPRPDLFPYDGGFAWGYTGTGTGTMNLAYAVLAEIHYDQDEIDQMAGLLVSRMLAEFSEQGEYTFNSSDVIQAITPGMPFSPMPLRTRPCRAH